jgi:hypothetical protein
MYTSIDFTIYLLLYVTYTYSKLSHATAKNDQMITSIPIMNAENTQHGKQSHVIVDMN